MCACICVCVCVCCADKLPQREVRVGGDVAVRLRGSASGAVVIFLSV